MLLAQLIQRVEIDVFADGSGPWIVARIRSAAVTSHELAEPLDVQRLEVIAPAVRVGVAGFRMHDDPIENRITEDRRLMGWLNVLSLIWPSQGVTGPDSSNVNNLS